MTDPVEKTPHHHGNLRAALIESGVSILIEDGLSKLTLRRCAARAGVSHAAPAHHFKGVAGLRASISEEGFRIFRNYMLDARNNAGTDAHDRLKAICRGYIYFAIDNPALFELAFSIKVIGDLQTKPETDTVAVGYDVLRETCAPFVPENGDPFIVESQVWSLIHGYATLQLTGRFGGTTPEHPCGPGFDQVISLLDHLPVLRRT
jgi:AcrR family transcriptional regulator